MAEHPEAGSADAPHDLPYRPGVGVMLINPAGLVFIGRRKGGPEHVAPGYEWQMPQGGIDDGEAPLPAAERELWEETGIRTIRLLAEAPEWIAYDLPREAAGRAWKGRYRGQRQRWFAFRFEGRDSDIDVIHPPDGHKPEFVAWRWEPMEHLPALVVPFKRPVYERVVAAFRHLGA
jgi:putative (di)nucleoside polyphosphate hydrolase